MNKERLLVIASFILVIANMIFSFLYLQIIPIAKFEFITSLVHYTEIIYFNGRWFKEIVTAEVIYRDYITYLDFETTFMAITITSQLILFFFSGSLINFKPDLLQKQGHWRIANRIKFYKIMMLIIRIIFLFGVLLVFGVLNFFLALIVKQDISPELRITSGFIFYYLYLMILLPISIIHIAKLLKIKLDNNRIPLLRKIAEEIVHSNEFETSTNQFILAYNDIITREDHYHLFRLIVEEKAIAGRYTNSFETIAKPFIHIHPRNISYYYDICKKIVRRERKEVAKELVETIDDYL